MSTKFDVVSRKRTNSLKVDVKTVTGVVKVAATAVAVAAKLNQCQCQHQTAAVDAAAGKKTCSCNSARKTCLVQVFFRLWNYFLFFVNR
jgi:DUF4097 and DUF4098 domain-containing protein YvlB